MGRSRRRFLLMPWFFVLALGWAGSEVVLPDYIQTRVQQALEEALQPGSFAENGTGTPGGGPREDGGGRGASSGGGGAQERTVQVRLAAFPALRLLFGSVDEVEVTAPRAHLDGLRVDNLHVEGRGVQVDSALLMRTGQLRVVRADALDARMEVSQESINEWLREQADSLGSLFQATVTKDGISFRGSAVLFGRPVTVTVEGTFAVRNGTRIDFLPQRVAVDEAQVPRLLLEGLTQSDALRVGVDVGNLPLPLEVSRVEFQPGRLVLWARGAREGEGVVR